MGNLLTTKNTSIVNLRNIINQYNCPIINLKTNLDLTENLDFIKPEDTNNNDIVKGVDHNQRQFIVIKATFILSNNEHVNTFSIFFEKDDNLWYCCGNYGLNMMVTEKSMDLLQFKFLDVLLQKQKIKLNKKINNTYKLKINTYIENKYYNSTLDNLKKKNYIYAKKIVIGWK